jgi:hypothetical protein
LDNTFEDGAREGAFNRQYREEALRVRSLLSMAAAASSAATTSRSSSAALILALEHTEIELARELPGESKADDTATNSQKSVP